MAILLCTVPGNALALYFVLIVYDYSGTPEHVTATNVVFLSGRSGHTKGVVNKAKTRDAEEANIVTILSRSDAT